MAFGQQGQQGFRNQLIPLFEAGHTFVVNRNGIFVYNGTPAAGNLVASMTVTNGTDSFGNAYLGPGIFAYNASTGQAVGLQDSSLTTLTGPIGGAGPWTNQAFLSSFFVSGNPWTRLVQGGTASVVDIDASALIRLFAQQVFVTVTGGTPITSDALEVNGGIAAINGVDAVVGGIIETWHTISSGFPAGWSGNVEYRFLAESANLVAMQINLQAAAGTVITTGETIFVLPSGYHHSGSFSQAMAGTGVIGPGFTVFNYAPLQIDPGGNVNYQGNGVTVPAGDTFFWGAFVLFSTVT